ncbi:MAG: hypothetical protein LKI80_15655 [Sporolactobacillus sp.]|jgi:hypothetical protein|nr:hypothetical protein [Sporolactobacillus sp.]
MSKYDLLWQHIQNAGREALTLSFAEIEKIAGVAIDHSFLRYKKALRHYGYQVQKISLKKRFVTFNKVNQSEKEP